MTKTELKKVVQDGTVRYKAFLVLKIETQGHAAPEIIINPSENVSAKLAYIDKAYNEKLELIKAKEAGKRICIVDATMTSNLSDLNWFVY